MKNTKQYIPSVFSIIFLFFGFTPWLLDVKYLDFSLFLIQLSAIWFSIAAWVFFGLAISKIRRSKRDNTYNKHMLLSLIILMAPYPVIIIAFFNGYMIT